MSKYYASSARIAFIICLILVWIVIADANVQAGQNQGRQIVLLQNVSGPENSESAESLHRLSLAVQLLLKFAGYKDELAILTFSDRVKLLHPLGHTPTGKDASSLQKKIKSIKNASKFSDLERALDTAYFEFTLDDPGSRALVVISSRGIDLDGDHAHESVEEAESRERILLEVIERFRKNGIPIYTIFDESSGSKKMLSDLSRLTNGLSYAVTDRQKFGSAFYKVFNQISAPQLAPVNSNRFEIDRSIREATVLVKTVALEDKMVLVSPKGRKFKQDGKAKKIRWGGNDVYTMATIGSPKAGQWRIEGLGENAADVLILTDLNLEAAQRRTVFYADEPIPVTAQISLPKEDGKAIPLETDLTAVLLDPAGIPVQSLALEDNGSEDGSCSPGRSDRLKDGVYSGIFDDSRLRIPGSYTVQVQASSETFVRVRRYRLEVMGKSWLRGRTKKMVVREKDPLNFYFDIDDGFFEYHGKSMQKLVASDILFEPYRMKVIDPLGIAIETKAESVAGGIRIAYPEAPLEGLYKFSMALKANPKSPVCLAQQKELEVSLDFQPGAMTGLSMGVSGYQAMLAAALIGLLVMFMMVQRKAAIKRPVSGPSVKQIPVKNAARREIVANGQRISGQGEVLLDSESLSMESENLVKAAERIGELNGKESETTAKAMGEVDSLLAELDGLTDNVADPDAIDSGKSVKDGSSLAKDKPESELDDVIGHLERVSEIRQHSLQSLDEGGQHTLNEPDDSVPSGTEE